MSMFVPSMEINSSDLKNLIQFVFKNEKILKEFGGIKITLNSQCQLALKKRQISCICSTTQIITKISKDQLIYSVEKKEHTKKYVQQQFSITNEQTFWSVLKDSQNKWAHSSISRIKNQTLFYKKFSKDTFSIHSIPKQSLLQLGGKKVLDHIVSSLTRSNGPGGIYPLSNNEHELFSLIYHHQGGPRHWIIIPAYQREHLRRIINEENPLICLEHGQLLIDPLFLDKHHIKYHKLIQYPNQFVILSAGVLSQSFTEDSSWSESISFALPS
ncbi:unnamed protein product [Adineta steineri]|uniref:JmjC domain-containing protein n=1 Tax=Adineta steineri TaxID=433720 RepID=A0A815PYI9_9BILA|nr:unnamed protein product [Adineta steineri]CAF1455755.1 unnamed protein product [Adineta steineri]CAF3876375.1 unnamed protein product [Adineta steineri]CAF3953173.1 unnamed protein product [Adineta steineri]